MKQPYLYICTVLATCLLSACKKSYRDFDDYELSLTAFITPSETRLTFTAAASEQYVTIKSNCPWTVSASQDWIHVSINAYRHDEVVVEAEMNMTDSQREATIILSGEKGASATIVVEQKAFEGTTFSVDNNGQKVSFKMIKVGKGSFKMRGSVDVTLTKDYFVGETEVTQALWYAVMGQSPTFDGESWISSNGLGDNYPAYYISYEDCQQFLTKLNQLTGRQFRFPTEAEWEFAARGGTKSKGYTYAGSNTIDEVAWYEDNSGYKTHEVKTKKPNELGLYDMSGNVDECCADWYDDYSSTTVTDPTGPTSGSSRVCRGGCWGLPALRVNYDYDIPPTRRYDCSGFRLAL